jgi:cell division protein FtsI (penicillin-binding protein 3)
VLPRGRFRLLVAVLAGWLAVVVGRLAQVQVLQHERWQGEAAKQQEKTVEVEEPRGDIISRDGRVLASSLERVAVYVNPRQVPRERWADVARRLGPIVGMPAEAVRARFGEKDGFFYLAKDLEPDVATAVAQLRERGIGTLRMEHRVYPQGELAGPMIGFVDGEGVGQAGLESFYDRTLRGTPSVFRLLRDGKTLPTPLDLRLEKQGRAGISLVLTIDARIQAAVEQELAATLGRVGGKGASAVVLDPRTGEVLALASMPSYDPDRPGDATGKQRRDQAIEVALEPGSTFKPFIVADAIEHGLISPGQMIDCSGGGVQIAGFFIHDHATYGALTVRDLLTYSSNAGAIRIAQMVPPEQLDEFITRFGFGSPTGVELPAETSGVYRGPRSWSALSRAGLAIGQEITVSPLQLAQGYAVFANGGLLVRPTIVTETRDQNGRVLTPYRPRTPVRVLSPEVARQMAELLTGVVDEGTGIAAHVPGYRIAGKTGTAQKPVAGSYRAGAHAPWFAGFLPLPDPQLVIVVCVDEPHTTFWASDVAAPTFGHIAARLVALLGIPPSSGATA